MEVRLSPEHLVWAQNIGPERKVLTLLIKRLNF
jgi:hypothetical protein